MAADLPLAALVFGGVGLACGLVYGFALEGRPASALRALVKTGALGGFALAAGAAGAPWPLLAALVASAAGDFFLARAGSLALAAGMLAFLWAHLLYAALFLELILGAGEVVGLQLRLGVMAGVGAGALWLIVWLWRDLGLHRFTAPVYAAVIVAMTVCAWLLPFAGWPAMAGALLFAASDAALAVQLFARSRAGLPRWVLSGGFVWWSYLAAQGLIVLGLVLAWADAPSGLISALSP